MTITLGNGKTTHSGQTVWTCTKVLDAWELRKWAVSPVDEKTVGLEPSGRNGAVIFAEAGTVYATAEEARDAAAKRLEGELEQVRGLAG